MLRTLLSASPFFKSERASTSTSAVLTSAAHDHAHESLDPMIRARECAYEHVQVLLEQLTSLGHDVSIDMPDDAFDELERIEG
jgi:hypothetical protein